MKIQSFTVLPDTPEKLAKLNELAKNLYFSWHPDLEDLFRSLCPVSWTASKFNPAKMLCIVPQEKLNQAAEDPAFITRLNEAHDRFSEYLIRDSWYQRNHKDVGDLCVAYFCAEFGLHECLPIYSGGLGVLAGDHLKSASDLGIPMIGVGLLYRQGYFRQYLNADGMQQEEYPENDWYTMPVHLEVDDYGAALRSSIIIGHEEVWFQIWRVDVGRCPIYLLDTNLEDNPPETRDITKTLYDPSRDVRIRQEILLGMGGIKALRALGKKPTVYHVNEGHSAFLFFQRIMNLMKESDLSYNEARQLVWSTSLFTNHTPVPAGNERFSPNLMATYFKPVANQLGLEWDEFMALGRENPGDQYESFCMTALALRMAANANGVSRLHGNESRKTWRGLFPKILDDEIPIEHVTNGIHAFSWFAPGIRALFQEILPPEECGPEAAFDMWNHASEFSEEALWKLRQEARDDLVNDIREHLRWQLLRRGAKPTELGKLQAVFDPDALTIGFARRFATYKRGHLFLKNPERLAEILNNPDRPVQIVIAGKAHPADQKGKAVIRHICEIAARPEFNKRIVFLEDYDIALARKLVRGVDLWLNTPQRPMEASGTSGMKAAVNGGLNLSILDGWWDEGYSPDYGWAIGRGETFHDDDRNRDKLESETLYGILEHEVVPIFYGRDERGLPVEWVRMMKRSICAVGTEFNSHRMVEQYVRNYYEECKRLSMALTGNGDAPLRELTAWRKKLQDLWSTFEVTEASTSARPPVLKGEKVEIKAKVRLPDADPKTLIVECYHGALDSANDIRHPTRSRMNLTSNDGDVYSFETLVKCSRGGRYGFSIRILPGHPLLAKTMLPNLVTWLER